MRVHVLLALLLLSVVLLAWGQDSEEDPSGKLMKNPPPALIREELPYIKCQVCDYVASALANVVADYREKKAPIAIDEYEVVEIMENVCKPLNETGHWIRAIDIREASTEEDPNSPTAKRLLAFTAPGGISKCNSECVTIAHSCVKLMENEVDPDELSVFLYKKSPTAEQAREKLCRGLTSRCKKGLTYLPPDFQRKQEIHFFRLSEKDIQMEEMMQNLQKMGMKGSLKAREDMDQMMEEYKASGSFEEYEDDEF